MKRGAEDSAAESASSTKRTKKTPTLHTAVETAALAEVVWQSISKLAPPTSIDVQAIYDIIDKQKVEDHVLQFMHKELFNRRPLAYMRTTEDKARQLAARVSLLNCKGSKDARESCRQSGEQWLRAHGLQTREDCAFAIMKQLFPDPPAPMTAMQRESVLKTVEQSVLRVVARECAECQDAAYMNVTQLKPVILAAANCSPSMKLQQKLRQYTQGDLLELCDNSVDINILRPSKLRLPSHCLDLTTVYHGAETTGVQLDCIRLIFMDWISASFGLSEEVVLGTGGRGAAGNCVVKQGLARLFIALLAQQKIPAYPHITVDTYAQWLEDMFPAYGKRTCGYTTRGDAGKLGVYKLTPLTPDVQKALGQYWIGRPEE